MAVHAKSGSTLPTPLPSGDFTDLCADCGTRIVARTIDDVDGSSCACPPRRYEYRVELICALCSRPIGKLRVPTPRTRIVLLRPLRCSACGGQATAGGDVERVEIPQPIKFEDEMPRAGRPPRWLVELRRRTES